jgi:hypothetical protein
VDHGRRPAEPAVPDPVGARARLHLPGRTPDAQAARRPVLPRPDEIRDLVADGLLRAGLVGVQTENLRPFDFGGREGLRFEWAASNSEGLYYQGQVAAFEHEKGLALAVFIAPREYYYPRDAAKVSRMLDTLRWR